MKECEELGVFQEDAAQHLKLTFFILHHATKYAHTKILIRCLQSIRRLYPKNPIVICKTSTTAITEDIISSFKVRIVNTAYDGSTIWGGICSLIDDIAIDNYILLHDSMVLLKKLPSSIFDKSFYPIWDFEGHREDHHSLIESWLSVSNFAKHEIEPLLRIYDEHKTWKGLFGPAFGGKRKALEKIEFVLDLKKNIHLYAAPKNIMCAERFLSIIIKYLNIINSKPLCGTIFDQPFAWRTEYNVMPLSDILNVDYDSYVFKSWVNRT